MIPFIEKLIILKGRLLKFTCKPDIIGKRLLSWIYNIGVSIAIVRKRCTNEILLEVALSQKPPTFLQS